MRRTRHLPAVLLLVAALAGCTSDPDPAAAPATSTPAPTSAAASPSPSASPSASPSYTPTLPTEMTDEGGDCVKPGSCGYYVAGPSCKGIEWCKPAHLVEPGTWVTNGGSDPTDCMWGVSLPPKYGVDDGGYAPHYLQVEVPKGAIFSTRDCDAGWTWLHP